ncbi:MAG: cation diffusion facilitator family transporter [Planctomycetota bacterium]
MHNRIEQSFIASGEGIETTKWSLIILSITALLQAVIVYFTASVALLADTLHNIVDAMTSIPLWIAFTLTRLKPTRRFTYGYGRVEDVVGVVIVFMILLSAGIIGYESINRLVNPRKVDYVGAVCFASIIGFLGNELVARIRIKKGREIGSAALVADGYHARTDALTSLAVLIGALGIYFGYPVFDPVIGLIITGVILKIVFETGVATFTRLLDGVDPSVIDEIKSAVKTTQGVQDVSDVRVRWSGHQLYAEVNIAVNPKLTVEEAHNIAKNAVCNLLRNMRHLYRVTIHIDPENASGDGYHCFQNHIENDISVVHKKL